MKVTGQLKHDIMLSADGLKAAQLKQLNPRERKVLDLAVNGKSISKNEEKILNSLPGRLNEINSTLKTGKSTTLVKIQKKLGIIISSEKLEKSVARAPIKRLWRNSKKAIEEHKLKNPSEPFVSVEKGLPSVTALTKQQPIQPLQVSYDAAENQGVRPTMEDAHFYRNIPQGVITGVFDGHGGSKVANHASEQFSNRFSAELKKYNGNVAYTFQSLINEIHDQVVEKKWDDGATAVICFIDKNSGRIYTATLGDSEANIYRKVDEKMQSIPLSPIRDWSSKSDAKRAAVALDKPSIAKNWPKEKNPKNLRFPFPFHGINVSRAIGDVRYSKGISHKAKITVNQLQSGDKIVIACDGLRDFVSEKDIAKIVNSDDELAQKLVHHAVGPKQSKDNVSVIVLKID